MSARLLVAALALSLGSAAGFRPLGSSASAFSSRARQQSPLQAECVKPTASPTMNFFDGITKLFKSDPRTAVASHILFKDKDQDTVSAEVRAKLESGELSFADAAREYSACPSRSKGGDLGRFRPGQMVGPFDRLVFSPETKLEEVYTVKTVFGTHLVKVTDRTEAES